MRVPEPVPECGSRPHSATGHRPPHSLASFLPASSCAISLRTPHRGELRPISACLQEWDADHGADHALSRVSWTRQQTITTAHFETTPGADGGEIHATTREIESANPLWIVVFGLYSRQFVAFPSFTVPKGTVIPARYPTAMRERMRHIEHAAHIERDEERDRMVHAAPADDGEG
jgi:hypothetical protein